MIIYHHSRMELTHFTSFLLRLISYTLMLSAVNAHKGVPYIFPSETSCTTSLISHLHLIDISFAYILYLICT